MINRTILLLLLVSGLTLATACGSSDDPNNDNSADSENTEDATNTDTSDTNDTTPPTHAASGDFQYTAFTALRTVGVNDVATFNIALDNAQPGDDIVLADGTYTAVNTGQDPDVEHIRFAGAFYPRVSGTQANPIRIRAASPGNVHLTIAPNPGNDGPVLSIGGKQHIIISDLIIDAEQSAIREDTGFVAITGSSHIYFENNVVNGVAPAVPFVNNHAAVYVQNVTQSRFASNLIQNMSNHSGSHDGEGILMYGVNRTTFEYNTSQNINGPGIYLKGDLDAFGGQNNYENVIRYNYATNCGTGIMVTGNGQHVTTRTLIYQNLSDNCSKGVLLHGWTSFVDVFNNTAVNNYAPDGDEYTGGIVIAGVVDGDNHDNRIWGNLVYGVSAQFASWLRCLDYWTASTNYTSTDNFCQNSLRQKQNDTEYADLASAQAIGYEPGTIEAGDPFINYAGGDFRLHDTNYTNGPYVPDTAGIYSGTVPVGAYITGTEQIGRN